MIIIVEGIDRVGKTTLCKKLSDVLGAPIIKHSSMFPIDRMDNANETDKITKMLDIYSITRPLVIFDRLHLTDFVYGICDRNYDIKDAFSNLEVVENELKKYECIVIYVVSENVQMSSEEHGKNLRCHEQYFNIIFDKSELYKLKTSYSKLDETVKTINNILNEEV